MKHLLKLYIKRALALFLKTHGKMPMKDLRKVFLGITSELVSADDVDIDIQQVQRGIFREELNNLISYYQAESHIVHHDLTNEPVLEFTLKELKDKDGNVIRERQSFYYE